MAWIYSIYAIAIATFIFSGTEVSAATWTRVESGRYEVLTDGAAKEAQRAWQVVEQTSLALDRVMGTLPPTAPPVRVILFRSETDFRKFRDNPVTRGFYQGSPERDYLVLPVSVWMKDRVLKHEMAHLYLNHTTGPLPQWLEEGMAEFLSTLEVQPGKALVGRVIEPHVELLTRADWIPAERLLHVSKGSAEFNQQHQAGLFYAESWALVHMLQHDAAYRGKMAALTTAISEGVGAEAAIEQVYGKTVGQLFSDLGKYVGGRRFALNQVALATESRPPAAVNVMNEMNATEMLADLYMAVGNLDAAREMYAKMVAATPDNREDHYSAKGFLALRDGQNDLAAEHFRRSIDAGSRNAGVHFELAMLLRDTRRDEGSVEPLLQQATALNPSFAEAWYQLGLLQMRQSRMEAAVESFRKAAKVLPRQSPFWDALAHAYAMAGAREPAKHAAWRALEAATTEEQRRTAQGTMREVAATRSPAAQRTGPDVRTPEAWQGRKGDAKAEGTLSRVDCSGASLVFVVETDGESGRRALSLVAANPGAIRVNGGTAPREFSCGAGLKLRVSVEYVESTRELVAIEYR